MLQNLLCMKESTPTNVLCMKCEPTIDLVIHLELSQSKDERILIQIVNGACIFKQKRFDLLHLNG